MYKNQDGQFIWKISDLYLGLSEMRIFYAESALNSDRVATIYKVIATYRLLGYITDEELLNTGLKAQDYMEFACSLAVTYTKHRDLLEALVLLTYLISSQVGELIEAAIFEIEKDVRYQDHFLLN